MKSDQLTTELRDYLMSKRVVNPLNVTLTNKQSFNGIKLDEITSERNFRHFKNVLNRRVFGNGYKRFGKELQMLVVREISSNQRHHIHCVIEHPKRYEISDFERLIRDVWTSTDFGYEEIHIEQPSSQRREDGWLSYIMKDRTKVTLDQSIDWINSSVLHH